MITLDTIGDFTWGFGAGFLIETSEGVFEWMDPEYGGDNTIRPYKGDLHDISNYAGQGLMGRCKGEHRIGDYCGKDVIFLK